MPIKDRYYRRFETREPSRTPKHHHEREFDRFLQTRSGIMRLYEPVVFSPEDAFGNPLGQHIPDFGIKNLESGKESYLEITTSRFRNSESDPKGRVRRIVDCLSMEIGENILYIVMYSHHLMRIQQAYPELELDFFNDPQMSYPK